MKYSLKRFFKNLKYLARFDLKEINNRPEVSSFTFGMAERLQYAIKNDFNTIYPPLKKIILKPCKRFSQQIKV